MIVAGQLLLTDDAKPGNARLCPGYVRLDGAQIVEVVEGDIPRNADLGGPGAMVCPGFIDTHLHLPQFDTIGAHGLPLLEWLADVTFPAERRWEDTRYARAMTQRVVDQLLAHGTTGICAYATIHHDATLAALEVADAAGLRGVIGQTLINRNAPDYLTRSAAQLLDETANLLDRFPPTPAPGSQGGGSQGGGKKNSGSQSVGNPRLGSRMSAAITPRFAITCTADFMAEMGKLAAERDAVIQSHLAETVPECELIAELFDGTSYVDVYKNAGLLTPRSLYGHGIYLDSADRDTLADASAIVAHCPTANSFLRSGTMNRQALTRSRVNLALGSDIGGGYERSMVRVARAMVEAASSFADTPAHALPSAAEAWWQITAGNADALGWADAGRLAAGAAADLVVIEPDIAWQGVADSGKLNQLGGTKKLQEAAGSANPTGASFPQLPGASVDPLAMLLFAWDDRWIKQTLVQGRTAYGHG